MADLAGHFVGVFQADWVAVASGKEFVEGRETEVVGGDGLGTIILPRPLPEPVIEEVMDWPE